MMDACDTVVECPAPLVREALAIVLRELAPEQRSDVAAGAERYDAPFAALFVALRDREVRDAAWGQPQSGSTAVFWPPQGADATAKKLAQSVVEALDRRGIRMAQTLVSDGAAASIPVLESAGFARLAELLYLSWETTTNVPRLAAVVFEPYDESQHERLNRLTEATYADTQDCPAMNGRRPMHEVMEGYRGTGQFRPENWFFVRAGGDDVGVLLLAEHEGGKFWELVYMGVVREFRGRGWGREIVRHAQQVAAGAGAERLLVAVDAANAPALKLYHEAGFTPWDCRRVYARFADEKT